MSRRSWLHAAAVILVVAAGAVQAMQLDNKAATDSRPANRRLPPSRSPAWTGRTWI